jgi:hypothetical protein
MTPAWHVLVSWRIQMTTVDLLPRTRELLDETLPDEVNMDAKLRRLIEAEYLRELARYRRTELALGQKYGLSFEEFTTQRVTRRLDYSWEVEQDAMAWETAVGGMATVERKLRELRALDDQSPG